MVRSFGLAVLTLWAISSVEQAPKPELPPTYHGDIAPVLAKSCLPCHRSGGVAPFSLETFADVKRRASLVQYQVLSQAMPPHRVRSDFDELTDAPPVSDAAAVRLQEWIRAGAPEGEARPKPEPKKSGWRLGAPDLVVRPILETQVRADGAPFWMLHIVKIPSRPGEKLRGFDLRPASPTALRSAVVGYATARGLLSDGASDLSDPEPMAKPVIGSWAPGFRPWAAPRSSGMDLGAEPTHLAVMTHYRPTGKVEKGGFEMALYFEPLPNAESLTFARLGVEEFAIEANRSLKLESELVLKEDVKLVSLVPEARFFASAFEVFAQFADGRIKTLYATRRWNPYWAGSYCFAVPPRLPKGTRIFARATYDNDERCTANEGKKPQRVVSGPKLTDEVFRVHLVFTSTSQHK